MEHAGLPVYSGPGTFHNVVDALLVQPRLDRATTILYNGLKQVGRGCSLSILNIGLEFQLTEGSA